MDSPSQIENTGLPEHKSHPIEPGEQLLKPPSKLLLVKNYIPSLLFIVTLFIGVFIGVGLTISFPEFFSEEEIPVPPEPTSEKDLNPKYSTPTSEKDLNPKYSELKNLLQQKKWRDADNETISLMLKVAGRKKLRKQDIDNFSCTDLRTIDQLWVEYSDGKFGFSVQKEIYQSLGGTKNHNDEVWEKFGDQVGWRKEYNWLERKDLIWREETSLHYMGHLPYMGLGWPPASQIGFSAWSLLFSRADTCGL
ncbi:MAG: GUN4 domain-containing protein [Okeania sp. SIO2F4]|nr:GUN4 domain-containing protein [Okeania sp. SIO2F4]